MSIFSRPKLGIDIGTSQCKVYLPKKGIVLKEPSLVTISKIDNEVVAIGEDAKDIKGKSPEEYMTINPIKNGVVSDYKIAEIMLRDFFKRALGNLFLIKPSVILSVPSNVSSSERRSMIDVAKKAGAINVYTEKEPILAALGAGLSIFDSKGSLVLDIGAGTSDSAVISLGGVVSSVFAKIGGNDIDEAIVNYIKERYGILISKRMSENVKINIGSAVHMTEDISYTIKGKLTSDGSPVTKEITSNEIVPTIQTVLDKIISSVKEIFHDIPPELVSDIIEGGIILTGGTSNLNGLSDFIEDRLDVEAIQTEGGEDVVANGMGTLLKEIDEYKKVLSTKR